MTKTKKQFVWLSNLIEKYSILLCDFNWHKESCEVVHYPNSSFANYKCLRCGKDLGSFVNIKISGSIVLKPEAK